MDSPSIGSDSPIVLTETRLHRQMALGQAIPRFLQGVYPFAGRGIFELTPLHERLTYTVPAGKCAQVVYFRAGNHSDDLLYLAVSVDQRPVRYFPIGPKGDFHVPLAIVEDHPAGARIDICIGAPRGLSGTVIVDVGLVEIEASRGLSHDRM
ncbi:MAG: molybdopterin oxidoreductase [Capsulimonadaceae bacterium]